MMTTCYTQLALSDVARLYLAVVRPSAFTHKSIEWEHAAMRGNITVRRLQLGASVSKTKDG